MTLDVVTVGIIIKKGDGNVSVRIEGKFKNLICLNEAIMSCNVPEVIYKSAQAKMCYQPVGAS